MGADYLIVLYDLKNNELKVIDSVKDYITARDYFVFNDLQNKYKGACHIDVVETFGNDNYGKVLSSCWFNL